MVSPAMALNERSMADLMNERVYHRPSGLCELLLLFDTGFISFICIVKVVSYAKEGPWH